VEHVDKLAEWQDRNKQVLGWNPQRAPRDAPARMMRRPLHTQEGREPNEALVADGRHCGPGAISQGHRDGRHGSQREFDEVDETTWLVDDVAASNRHRLEHRSQAL
jgi:hypothetical protein